MTKPIKPAIDPAAVYIRIREIVAMHGTIRAAAELCGLREDTLATYANGKSLPGSLALACICKGLGVSADWLLFGEVDA